MKFETTICDTFGTLVRALDLGNVVEKSTQMLRIMSAPAEGHTFKLVTFSTGRDDITHLYYEFKDGRWVDEKGFEYSKGEIEIAIWKKIDHLELEWRNYEQHA